MAINLSEYELIDTGIRLHESNSKVLVDLSIPIIKDGKQVYRRKRKVIPMAKREGWGLREYKIEAKRIASGYLNPADGITIDEKITIKGLFDEYMKHYPEKDWKKVQNYTYEKHIDPSIGKMKAVEVKRVHIDRIITSMRSDGLKPRTQKLILNVLRPIFTYAIQNEILRSDPTKNIIIKLPKTKKEVGNATEVFKKLWKAINKEFGDDSYYKALYYFALLHGRRKGEILGMRWSNIDFDNMCYTIEKTKSGEDQTYTLPDIIAYELGQMPHLDEEIVFISARTGEQLVSIRGQDAKIRKASGVENFTIHYCRNVLVSLMAEHGASATFLSGVLGHTDINTINKYLSMPRQKASEAAIDVVAEVLR